MNDIVLHFDERINERPGEMSGFILMLFSLFFYLVTLAFIFILGSSHLVTIYMLMTGITCSTCIPIGGIIEICCSGKGTLREGIWNSLMGAGSVFWCCCYGN